jgi:CheY-like chemotaxis protein
MMLAAEDDPGDALLLSHAFERANLPCQMMVTWNGEETIRFLARAGTAGMEFPQLILLDLIMPVVDGFGVLRWIQNDERSRKIPVVALSGSTCPAHRAEALRLGAREFLAKGWDRQEIVTMLQFLHGRYVAGCGRSVVSVY